MASEMKHGNNLFWPAFVILLGVIGAWYFTHLGRFQWDNDEGILTMEAWAVNHGHQLYTEIGSEQPPGLTFALAWAFQLFGSTVAVARSVGVALALAGVAGLGVIVYRLAGTVAGLATVLLITLSPHFFWLARTVNPDLPSLALGVLGLAFVQWYLDKGARKALIAAGLLLGAGLSIKLSAGLLLPIFVGAVALRVAREFGIVSGDGRPIAARGSRRVYLAAGTVLLADCLYFMVPLGLVVSLWWRTAPSPALISQVFGVFGAARAVYPDRSGEYALWLVRDNLMAENLGLLILASFGLIWFLVRRRGEAILIGAWFALTCAALTFQRPMWPKHHWSLVLWPLALAAGLAVGAMPAAFREAVRLLGQSRAARASDSLATDPDGDVPPLTPRTRRVTRQTRITLLTLALWLFTVPATAGRLYELAHRRDFMAGWDGVRWVAENVPPDKAIISDNGLIAFRTGRAMPLAAISISSKRIRLGQLTGAQLIAAAADPGTEAVLIWNNQLSDFKDFMNWLPGTYERVEVVGDDREIWQRK